MILLTGSVSLIQLQFHQTGVNLIIRIKWTDLCVQHSSIKQCRVSIRSTLNASAVNIQEYVRTCHRTTKQFHTFSRNSRSFRSLDIFLLVKIENKSHKKTHTTRPPQPNPKPTRHIWLSTKNGAQNEVPRRALPQDRLEQSYIL